jgi:hypothetical protein
MPTKTAAPLGLILSLTACSQQSGSTGGAPATSTARATGTLTGLVRMFGGPVNRRDGKPVRLQDDPALHLVQQEAMKNGTFVRS